MMRKFWVSTPTSKSNFSAVLKRRWKNEKSSVLWVTFLTGYFGHVYINYQKRKELWYKVEKMYHEETKRSSDLDDKFTRYLREEYDDP